MTVAVTVNDASRLPIAEGAVERAVRTVLTDADVVQADVAVTFLDDAAIRTLNRDYLDHDWPTDVITFTLEPDPGEPSGAVSGEVYIGADRARAQADERGIEAREEALRLTVHGALHLIGLDHPDEDREASPFFVRQEDLVARVSAELGIEAGVESTAPAAEGESKGE